MISCSALQIGMLALMQNDDNVRRKYSKAMLKILNSHDCLTQLRVPDARRRGGTMRYWEAQYECRCCPICSTRLTDGAVGVLMPPIMPIFYWQ